MTPGALKAARLREGMSRSNLAQAARVSVARIVALERRGERRIISRPVREALLDAAEGRRHERWRKARRQRAALTWQDDPRAPDLLHAAQLLDRDGESQFADWLLRARPDWVGLVVTMTAVHVLLRGYSETFDAINTTGLVDTERFWSEYLGRNSDFCWNPSFYHLIP